MNSNPLGVYLNDHLAGAAAGTKLARRIAANDQTRSLADLMQTLAPQISDDRQTLIRLMRELGVKRSFVKRTGGLLAAAVSRAKFHGVNRGSARAGTFMAVESLALGVYGKLGLWQALQQLTDAHPNLKNFDLEKLAERAAEQHAQIELERQRLAVQELAT